MAIVKDYYSAQELATKLAVTDRTIRNMIARGEIGATKIARQWRISKTAWRAYRRMHAKPVTERNGHGLES